MWTRPRFPGRPRDVRRPSSWILWSASRLPFTSAKDRGLDMVINIGFGTASVRQTTLRVGGRNAKNLKSAFEGLTERSCSVMVIAIITVHVATS